MHDAIAEITANPRCKHPVSIVVLAMGANDVPDGAKHMGWIPARISDLMKAAKNIYPEAQVRLSLMHLSALRKSICSFAVANAKLRLKYHYSDSLPENS